MANCEPDFTSDWPTCADGTGNTLELISPDLDNSLPENWDCINDNGSPNAVNSGNLSYVETTIESIKIFPNPVKDVLYISGNLQFYNIELYSILGQKLLTKINSSKIDMSLLNNGVYLLKISNENSTYTVRVIKN